jgi:hypothetical protein
MHIGSWELQNNKKKVKFYQDIKDEETSEGDLIYSLNFKALVL